VLRDSLHAATRPLEVAGVEEEDEVRIDPVRRLGSDFTEAGQECVDVGQRRRDQDPDLFAGGAQRLRERQAAAEGVTVGILVPEDQDLLVGVDELLDLVVLVGRFALGGGYVSVSPS
jgi:hypothetical protein